VLLLVGFLLVALLLVGTVHWYLWRRLVRDTTTRPRWRRAGAALFAALALLVPGTLVGSRALPLAAQGWLAWPGYLWLALMFYLLVLTLLVELPRLAVLAWLGRTSRHRVLVARPGSAAAVHAAHAPAPGAAMPATAGTGMTRRLVVSRALAAGTGLVALGVTGSGVASALGPLRVRRVRLILDKLPPRMDGFRFALVSDVHLGPILGRGHTRRVVDTVNELDADVVAVVGDLVDGTVPELGPAAEPLAGLRSRRGAYFVTGNHEYFSGYRQWVDEVGALGLTVLRNQRVEVDGLDLAGVNDVTGESYGDPPDYDRALAGRDPARPVVLLAHQPVQVRQAARYGVDLQLSGHTHGGQLYPFGYLVRLQQPVVDGYARIDGTQLFVTKGAGFWGPPVRVGAPPDVALVELRARAA
jgi:uncharacterized protein